MRKKLKKVTDKFIKFLMLFMMIFSSLEGPITVFAAETGDETLAVGALRLGTDGPVSSTGSVSTTASSNDGKVDVTKTVTADPNNLGKYHVEFNIKGKSTQEKDPVYVVIVFDRSGSMSGRRKWSNAVAGAKSLASNVISSISTAQVALVTFGDSATKARDFSRNELTDSNFGSADGATNLHDGLIKANEYLSTINNSKAKKFIVVMSDGEPTYYVKADGSHGGSGYSTNEDILNATLSYADSLKNSASIYSIGYSLPSGYVYYSNYTYAGTTYRGLTAKQILSFIASPKTSGSGNNYYDASDEDEIVGVFNTIATSIIAAGGGATLTDNIGDSFRVVGTENYGGIKKSDTITEITDSGVKFEFDIEVNPDTSTGWHQTNKGFKLEYTDASGNKQEVVGTEDPYVYWVQAEYNYTVNYYKDSTSGTLLGSETRKATKNTVINESNAQKDKYLAQAGVGYEFKYTSPTSITIDGSGNQVINVIYGLKTFNYSVIYYYDDVKDSSLTEGPVNYGTTVDSKDYYLKTEDIKDGYKLDTDKTDNDVKTITDDNTVINIYYVKDNFGYTIDYFFNGVKKDNLSKSESALFGEVIKANDNYLSSETLTQNGFGDYFLHPTKPYDKESITIGSDATKNHIEIYYVNNELEGTVEKNTSTKEVTSSSDKVNYTVTYNGTVTNVKEGDIVTVTITDTLPYEIDERNSDLNGGSYSNKTITWTFTETMTEYKAKYEFNKTISYSVLYKNFADISSAENNKLINKASGTIKVNNKTSEADTDTAEVPVIINGTVIATYKDKDGNVLEKEVKTTGLAGSKYETSEKTINGYSLESIPTNQNGKYVGETTIYVNYVYVKNSYKYTINYHFNSTLDKDFTKSGNALFESVVLASDNTLSNDELSQGGYGDYFLNPITPFNPNSITIGTNENSNIIDIFYISTEVSGEIDKTTSTKSITSESDLVSYKVTYSASASNVKEGDTVTVTIIDTLPYEIDESKSSLSGGSYSNKTITWTFTETMTEFTESYEFNKTINYSVVYKNFADISSAENNKLINKASGTIKVNNKTSEADTDTAEVPVIINGTVIATYKDKDGNVLEKEVKTTGLAGSKYETSEKEIFGYELTEIPTNQNGKYVGETTIYVNYVYDKSIGYSEEELTKTGDNQVLSIDSPFNYTITYNTSIYDYVGDVEITIEDDPEFEINQEKSIISDNCDYSNGKIVCTYKVTISSEEDQDISITEKLTLYYNNIDKAEVNNNAKATVKYGNETKETDVEETVIVPSGKVISKYITDEGEVLCDDVTTTGLVGEEYNTERKVFDDYSLKEVNGEETGKYTSKDITVTYVYSTTPLPPKTGYEGGSFDYLSFVLSLIILYVIKRRI